MIQKHEQRAHEAASQGAQFILFQELFYGPYFCQVQDAQYYSYTELIPDGPTTKRMQDLAKQTGMVVVAPMYEEDEKAAGIYYNTAAVIDADGTYLGKYRKTHIPHVKGFWEKFYFRPGNLGYPGVRDRGRQGRRVHLLRPPLPGGRPGARPQRRRDRADPQRDVARPVRVPVADRAARATRSPTATTSGRSTGSASRPTSATTTSTARATSSTRAASSSATWARPTTRSSSSATWTSTGSWRSATPGSSIGTGDPTPTRTSRGPSSRYHPSGSAVWRRTAEPRSIRGAGGGTHAVRLHPQARAHPRAHARPDPPGRGRRVRLRLAVRLARAVAGAVSAADADGRGHGADAAGDVRDEPGDPRADGDRLGAGELNEISGGRMDLGIGRGDSARRVLGKPPTTMANTRGGDPRHPGARRRRGRSTTRARRCASRGPRAGRCRSGSPATARWRWR